MDWPSCTTIAAFPPTGSQPPISAASESCPAPSWPPIECTRCSRTGSARPRSIAHSVWTLGVVSSPPSRGRSSWPLWIACRPRPVALSVARPNCSNLSNSRRVIRNRLLERGRTTPTIRYVQTVQGSAGINSIVIDRKSGSTNRFASFYHFDSPAGVVTEVKASGSKIHCGKMLNPSNTYLMWAFIGEAIVFADGKTIPAAARGRLCPFSSARTKGRIAPSPQGRWLRPSRGDLLGPQEDCTLPGATPKTPGGEEVNRLSQVAASAHLTWLHRETPFDRAAPTA